MLSVAPSPFMSAPAADEALIPRASALYMDGGALRQAKGGQQVDSTTPRAPECEA